MTAEIVDDIVPWWLRPLNTGVVDKDVVEALDVHIKMVRKGAEYYCKQMGPPAVIRKRVASAVAALTALEKVLPHPAVKQARELIEPLTTLSAPDPRTNILHSLCAHHAWAVVKHVSKKRPVTTQNGNLHLTAQMFLKRLAGTLSSEAGLLRAVKKVKRWQDGNNPADGLLWTVKMKFR